MSTRPAAGTHPENIEPRLSVNQEVRLAIVMYGGVSLAVYINGVTQELYNLVRATAPTEPGGRSCAAHAQLQSTLPVYRKLGQALSRGAAPQVNLPVDAPIRTRFLIDILSGTSAGGINAIVLAKALANNQQTEQLKRLWIDEADIDKLLNERVATPASLLDSRHMYKQILAAFDGMDDSGPTRQRRPATPAPASPNVDELDLFVTATDIRGVTLPLRLAHKIVYEKRHRKVFHLRYTSRPGDPQNRNDFLRPYNPFLAFVARCTSAFPFAFEPQLLADIPAEVKKRAQAVQAGDLNWRVYFGEYAPGNGADALTAAVANRAFSDGGSLDNKPFSHAIDALLQRRANVPVERKLVYIEPSPEHPERAGNETEVDVIENVSAAVLSLPRYETIREDLERVLKRNRVVERVHTLTSGIEEDLRRHTETEGLRAPYIWRNWQALSLGEMTRRIGPSFGSYHRLKVAALTDDLAQAIMLAAGLDPSSEYFPAIRALVRAWRGQRYFRYAQPTNDAATTSPATTSPAGGTPPPKPENTFLVDFDLSYRLRRLLFVRGKIDALSCLDDAAAKTTAALMSWYERGDPALADVREAAGNARLAVNGLLRRPPDLGEMDTSTAVEPATSLEQRLQALRDKAQELLPQFASLRKFVAEALPAELAEMCANAVKQGGNKLRSAASTVLAQLDKVDMAVQEADAVFQVHMEGWRQVRQHLNNQGTWPAAADAATTRQDPTFQNAFQQELMEIKEGLNKPYSRLLRLQREFWEPSVAASDANEVLGPGSGLRLKQLVAALGLPLQELRPLVDSVSEEERDAEAAKLLKSKETAFAELASYVQKSVKDATWKAADDCHATLAWPPVVAGAADLAWFGRLTARACVRHYFYYYDEYDLVLFPVLYRTEVGEVAKVDVIRISPEDAPRDPRAPEPLPSPDNPAAAPRPDAPKLAGTTLANFGAFLESSWRQNDLLWGRMDGAQRLITTLLPGESNKDFRNQLIDEAHAIILKEELRADDKAKMTEAFVKHWIKLSAGKTLTQIMADVAKEWSGVRHGDSKLHLALRQCLEEKPLLEYFRKEYQVSRELDPVRMLPLLARAAHVVGHMLGGVAERYRVRREPALWLARLAKVFWGMVQVAIPQSVGYLVANHAFNLIYLFGALLLVAGIVFVNPPVQTFAAMVLAATASLHLSVRLLGDYITGYGFKWGILRGTLVCVVLALLFLGGLQTYEILAGQGPPFLQGLRGADRLRVAAAAGPVLLGFGYIWRRFWNGVTRACRWLHDFFVSC